MNTAEKELVDVRDSTEDRTPSSTFVNRSPLFSEVELGGTCPSQESMSDTSVEQISIHERSSYNSLNSERSLPGLDWIQNSRLGTKFKNIKELNSGAFGTVYTGTHSVDGQRYALKMVEAAEEKVLQEAICMSNLSHGNIVRYNDAEIFTLEDEDQDVNCSNRNNIGDDDEDITFNSNGSTHSSDDGIIFESESQSSADSQSSNDNESQLAHSADSSEIQSTPHTQLVRKVLVIQMELYRGTLKEWVDGQHGVITNDLMRSFSINIIEGLLYIHNEGYMHRDLKPHNIFIGNKTGLIAKIGDFGSSRKAMQPVSQCGDHANRRSKMTDYIGTKPYCAPEVITGIYDKRIDLYSLGFILFEIWYPNLHGKTFQQKNPIFEQLGYKNVQFPEDFQGPIRDITRTLLQHNPEDRMGLLVIKKQMDGLGKGPIADNLEAAGDSIRTQDTFQNVEEAVRSQQVQPINENQAATSGQQLKVGSQGKQLEGQFRENLKLQEDTLKLQQKYHVRIGEHLTSQERDQLTKNLQQQKTNIIKQKSIINEEAEENGMGLDASEVQYDKIIHVKDEGGGKVVFHHTH